MKSGAFGLSEDGGSIAGDRAAAPGLAGARLQNGGAPRSTSSAAMPAELRSMPAAYSTNLVASGQDGGSGGSAAISNEGPVDRVAVPSIHVFRDFQVEAGQTQHLPRRGQHPHATDPQVAQDLRADAVGAQHAGRGLDAILQRTDGLH